MKDLIRNLDAGLVDMLAMIVVVSAVGGAAWVFYVVGKIALRLAGAA